jgi:hypothetical protein
MVANIGGALGDISWMDQTWPRIPLAGIHCRKDIFAPFDSGNVIVPTTQQVGTELEFVIMVIAVSCVKLLSAHNSTQHTSRKHKV